MFNKSTKTWSAPPPEYACIQGNGGTTNLKMYIAVTEPKGGTRGRDELMKEAKNRYGVTITLTELKELFDCE